MGWQASRPDMRRDPVGIGAAAMAELGGQAVGKDAANRHRLPVQQPVRKSHLGLQRMPEGVAKVQQRPLPRGFKFIGDNRCHLGPHGGFNGMGNRRRVPAKDGPNIGFQPAEETRVPDERDLRDFGIAGAQFPVGQRCQHSRVDQHQRRLMKGPDQVFARRAVNRGFATDRGIDLRQQGGRHLDEAAAAPQDRTGKTRQVANHPATERHDKIAAFHPERQQPVG